MSDLSREFTSLLVSLKEKMDSMRSELLAKRDRLNSELAQTERDLEALDAQMTNAMSDISRELGLNLRPEKSKKGQVRRRSGKPVSQLILEAMKASSGRLTSRQIYDIDPAIKGTTLNMARGKLMKDGLIQKKPHPEGKRGALYVLTAKGKKATA